MHMCVVVGRGRTCRGHKTALECLLLELQVVMSRLMRVMRTELRRLGRQKVLLTAEPALQLLQSCFN